MHLKLKSSIQNSCLPSIYLSVVRYVSSALFFLEYFLLTRKQRRTTYNDVCGLKYFRLNDYLLFSMSN